MAVATSALLQLLRPACMGLVASLEVHNQKSTPASAAAVENSLQGLHAVLSAVRDDQDLQQQLPLSLRFVMMPLKLMLAPAREQGSTSMVVSSGMQEQAMLCVTAVLHSCGERCVEGMDSSSMTSLFVALVVSLTRSVTASSTTAPPAAAAAAASPTQAELAAALPFTGAQEGLQLACVQCLEALLKAANVRRAASNSAVCQQRWQAFSHCLLTTMGGGLLAQLAQSVIELSQRGHSREVRFAAVSVLEGLLAFVPDQQLWRKFLPGMFSGLYKTIRGGAAAADKQKAASVAAAAQLRQGHSTTEHAFQVVITMLTVAFSGTTDSAQQLDVSTTSSAASAGASDALHMLQAMAYSASASTTASSTSTGATATAAHSTGKQDAWAAGAVDRLKQLLPSLIDYCRHHASWRVRAALAVGASQLLQLSCSSSSCAVEFKQLSPCLLQGLIGLLWDDMPQVATAAHTGVQR
jgi:hypothetical protein